MQFEEKIKQLIKPFALTTSFQIKHKMKFTLHKQRTEQRHKIEAFDTYCTRNKCTLAWVNAIVCLHDSKNKEGSSINGWYDTPWTRETSATKEIYMSMNSHPCPYLTFAQGQPGLSVCIHFVTQLAEAEVLQQLYPWIQWNILGPQRYWDLVDLWPVFSEEVLCPVWKLWDSSWVSNTR